MKGHLSIFLILLFTLCSGTVSAGIVTAEHRLIGVESLKDGGAQIELAITLTNHGGKDIDHVHFQFDQLERASLLSRYSPLQIERLPGGKSITVKWALEADISARQWRQGRALNLIGQGVVDGGTMVPLEVFSYAEGSAE